MCNLACRELLRCVRELGAVGSFVRPNLVNGHYWHSNYWDPLYSLHEDLDVTWGFHEGTGAWYSHMNVLYGENRFYRHVASHWIEMQQALIAMIIGGVFEFHPRLRVGFLEAQNSWVPGLLSRIEWDYPQYRDSHAPYLSLTPKEYFRRNCWAAVEGSEPEIEATARLIGADRMCISTDYPHFDSNFPNVSTNLLEECPRETRRGDLPRRRRPLRLHGDGISEGRCAASGTSVGGRLGLLTRSWRGTCRGAPAASLPISEGWAAESVAEEPALGSAVGVIVVGNIPHVIVHIDLAELAGRDLAEPLVHVRQMLRGRLRAVEAPDHHRHVAHIALGDPANIILVVPGRDAGCSTEIAVVDFRERGRFDGHGRAG